MTLSKLNPSNLRRSEDGFTLIELIVSLGMFAVALISMSVMFTTAFSAARSAQNRDIAKTVIQRKLENFRTVPFYIAFRDQLAGADPDLLDKYFPGLTPTTPTARTVDGVSVLQRYVGPVSGACPATTTPPACSFVTTQTGLAGLAGSKVDIWLRFVREPEVQNATPSPATTTVAVPPPTTYSADVADQDAPITKLVHVTMTVTWTERARTRTFSSDSIIRGTRTSPVKASAKTSTGGGSITGLKFPDGSVTADVPGILGLVSGEVTESDFVTSNANGSILDVREVDPVTAALIAADRFLVRPVANVSDSRNILGQTSPAVTLTTGAQDVRSTDGLVIASIGSGTSTARTALSNPHGGVESSSTQLADDLVFNYRSGVVALAQANIARVQSTSEVNHTNSQITGTTTTRLDGIQLWGTHTETNPAFVGTVLIDTITTDITATANGLPGGATARVRWSWANFRIWDPTLGGRYSVINDCDYDSDRDGTTYPACASNVVIPAAYGTPLPGESPESCTACSLAITIGATQSLGLSTGVSADGFQKNVLNIFFKNQGLRPLQDTTFALGDAAVGVTYSRHH